jgi:hypothetical protein
MNKRQKRIDHFGKPKLKKERKKKERTREINAVYVFNISH